MQLLVSDSGLETAFTIYLINKKQDEFDNAFSREEARFIKAEIARKQDLIQLNRLNQQVFIQCIDIDEFDYKSREKVRISASQLTARLNKLDAVEVTILDRIYQKDITLAFIEGLMLANYQFIKYFKNSEEKKNSLETVYVVSYILSEKDSEELHTVVNAVCTARTWINEPVSYLTAPRLSEEIKALGHESGFLVEVLDKAKIRALKMGGLLAVNRGSQDPPTFTILEWKPEHPKNSQPLVLVGKGVVYDSGGLSLKPTANSMDYMKSDMSGAAAVAGLLSIIAKLQLPLHVVGLIPATDNRPGENAVTPGDIIEMHNGLFVEVLNTDAEGRLILGDALSYAQKYSPELVIDLATLTGAASVTVGIQASIVMGNVDENIMNQLKKAGFETYERLVELPMWDEYGEMIKSDIADIKNSTKRDGGTITAGKFLERFTDYPWIHLDIASSAYLHSKEGYKPIGGVGVGIRLLYEFIKKRYLAG